MSPISEKTDKLEQSNQLSSFMEETKREKTYLGSIKDDRKITGSGFYNLQKLEE